MKSQPRNEIPVNFLSGGFALATSFAIMHPLDTLKTQLQTKTMNLKTLGRGFSVSYLMAFPQGGLRLSSYEFCKQHIGIQNVTVASAVSACLGDTVSSIVKVPREVITARLQSGMDEKLINSMPNSSPTAVTFREILREQGPRGLFRGFWSTTARDWPFMVILFATYESLKQNHHRFVPGVSQESKIDALYSTIFGGFSGCLAGFATTPFDVIKTNIMTNRSKTISISTVTSNLWAAGGAKSFFRGGGARSVWWFCVCSMFFPLYEKGKVTVGKVLINQESERKLFAQGLN